MRLVTAVALVAALLLTVGCVGLGASDGDAPTTPQPSVSATATDSCETDVLLTDDGSAAVTAKPTPDGPAAFEPGAVGRFAQEYERAFAHNHALGDRVTDVTVELQGTTARAVAGGYQVRIHVWTQTMVAGSTTDDVTAEDGTAGDGAAEATVEESFYDAHYYVSEGALRRAETERHGTLADDDLSASGVTLACWSG